MEISTRKSEEQAEIILSISMLIRCLDAEYCRKASQELINQANRQETLMVLNPSHPQSKNEILRHQGLALGHLCNYVEELKMVDKLKQVLRKEEEQSAQIKNLFF